MKNFEEFSSSEEPEFNIPNPEYNRYGLDELQHIEEDYDFILRDYFTKHTESLRPYLDKEIDLFPTGIDMNNLEEKIIDFYTSMEDFSIRNTTLKEIAFYDIILSTLRAKEFMSDLEITTDIAKEKSRLMFNELLSTNQYNNEEKIRWIDIVKEATGFNILNLEPSLTEIEIEMVASYIEDENLRKYKIEQFTFDLKNELVDYIRGSISKPEIAEDLVDDMVRFSKDSLEIYYKNGIVIPENERINKKEIYFQKLYDKFAVIMNRYAKFLESETIINIIQKIVEDYNSLYKEISKEYLEDKEV
jgi:hypothetical protein